MSADEELRFAATFVLFHWGAHPCLNESCAIKQIIVVIEWGTWMREFDTIETNSWSKTNDILKFGFYEFVSYSIFHINGIMRVFWRNSERQGLFPCDILLEIVICIYFTNKWQWLQTPIGSQLAIPQHISSASAAFHKPVTERGKWIFDALSFITAWSVCDRKWLHRLEISIPNIPRTEKREDENNNCN